MLFVEEGGTQSGSHGSGHAMTRRLVHLAMFFIAVAIATYVGSSLLLMKEGSSALSAFTHISIFYVPSLVVGISSAIAAWVVWLRRSDRQ